LQRVSKIPKYKLITAALGTKIRARYIQSKDKVFKISITYVFGLFTLSHRFIAQVIMYDFTSLQY